MAVEERGAAGDGGLRERKKAEMRQRISDIATLMFLEHGFDEVRVADIAARVGVSEKTVFNYFPTKESLVFDQADTQLASMLRAVRERPSGMTPTAAYVAELKGTPYGIPDDEMERARAIMPRFGALVRDTPSLRAAWGDHRHRMVAELAGVLAADAEVDPRDPEPLTTARALVSLTELAYDSILRRAEQATDGAELRRLVSADIDRGARLLDTGLWSLSLMIGSRRSADQLREATRSAEQARRQVMTALREAKRAWRELAREQGRSANELAREYARARHAEAREGNRLRGHGRA